MFSFEIKKSYVLKWEMTNIVVVGDYHGFGFEELQAG
jgi:hypothetical protein